MAAAKDAALAEFLDFCAKTKEVGLLAERVDAASAADLENISHCFTVKAATAFQRRHGVFARSCAMAMRIVHAGKSKYYAAFTPSATLRQRVYGGLQPRKQAT